MENDKSPMEQWKEIHYKYFHEVEDIVKDNNTDALFFHLPKFSRNSGIWYLLIIAVGMIALSYYLCLAGADATGSGGWMSNLLLNLAMGVIAGFIVFFYTIRRDRVMMGFAEVANIMKQRLTLFRSLVGDDGAISKIDPSFLFQTKSYDPLIGIDSLRANNQFNCVLVNYFKYLQRYLGPVFPNFDFSKVIAGLEHRNSDELRKINELLGCTKEHKKLDKDLKNECCRLVWETTQYIISRLDELFYRLQSSVYGVKFGRARCFSWKEMREKKTGLGGAINAEILKEGELHGVFAAKRVTNGNETTQT